MVSADDIHSFDVITSGIEEPAFVFENTGAFCFCNEAGKDAFELLSRPETYDVFLSRLQPEESGSSDSGFTLNGCRYRMATGRFHDKILLRLIPAYTNNHMLRLSSSLDIMPWGLMTIDRSGDSPFIIFSNERVRNFLRREEDKILGRAVAEIFRTSGITEDIIPFVLSPVICHHDHEGMKDGRIEWYRFHFIPYAPQSPYCLIVIEDTTEGKIMEGQYFQAQRLEALGQLAGGVAHDFNNILSIIDGYARIARKCLRDMPEPLAHLERISQAVQRGSALTSQLLTFGRHKVSNETVLDLGELVNDQASLLRPLMDASVALTIDCEKNVYVDVTADHICQILMNICINARDAMPDGGELKIQVRKTAENLALLQVADTGCGIPFEIQPKIFDPFFTTKDQGKGTGLGLSMVYGLVKGMNGEITVFSKEGQGTTFDIYLPLAVRALETPVFQYDTALTLNGLTALIAEDEPDLLNLVSSMMEEMGASVIRASNGSEALALQDSFEGEIDLLLTDVVMPELNGVKLAEMFGVLRPSSQIMFMSGYPAHGQMARVTLPEGSLLMPKPVDFDTLSCALKGITRKGRNAFKTQWIINSFQWKNA